MAKLQPSQKSTAELFSAAQAARLSGLSLSMVNYLCRTGIVEPTTPASRGHGRARAYTFGDVVALRLLAHLSKNGVSVLRLKAAMQGLRKLHPEITITSLPASHVVTNGKDVYLRREGEAVERAFDGQFAFAFVIELSQLQREVAESVSRSRSARSPKKAA